VDRTVWGVTRKKYVQWGVKNTVFCPRAVRKILIFVWGSTEISPPPVLFNGKALVLSDNIG